MSDIRRSGSSRRGVAISNSYGVIVRVKVRSSVFV